MLIDSPAHGKKLRQCDTNGFSSRRSYDNLEEYNKSEHISGTVTDSDVRSSIIFLVSKFHSFRITRDSSKLPKKTETG